MIVNLDWMGAAAPKKKIGEFFPVTVPGDIQSDYAKHMGWGDFNYMNNCKKYEEIEPYYWCYKTNVNCIVNEDERVFFVTKGIEYEYDIILNKKILLHHEGMFSPVEIDITDELKSGNELEILIYPHPMLEGKLGRQNASQCCKPAVGYGWDWHPRILVSGLWNDTYVEKRGKNYIVDAEATYILSDDLKSADVHFNIDCEGKVNIELFDIEGKTVYHGTQHDFHLDNINLWWCNGQGAPYLYTYRITSAENEKSGKIGFKKIRLVMNGPDSWKHPLNYPKGRSRAPITIELNNRVVFAKGSNWVNPDVFTGLISEDRYKTHIKYAKEANMNILRCWGGAIINKEPFFDACDEMGIMVWQEFPLACNNYIGTPSYLKILEQEAKAIVKRVRRHACHVLWCGGNELLNGWSRMTEQSHALRLLNKVCYEEDFNKPFIMTAPIKGMGHGHYIFEENDKTVFEMYTNANKSAYSEFGVPSIATIEQLKSIFTEETLRNPSNDINSEWSTHCGFRAWGVNRWCCFDVIEKIFGKQDCLEDYIEKSNIMQCEGYKFIFEETRKQAPNCSMALNWDFNEPWKNAAGHNLIQYPIQRKNSYYAVQSALRPTMPSIRPEHFTYKPHDIFSAELWLLNDAPAEFKGDTVEVYFTVSGEKKHIISWNTGIAAAGENIRGHKINIDIPNAPTQMMTLTLEAKCGRSEYRFLLLNDTVTEKAVLPQLNV